MLEAFPEKFQGLYAQEEFQNVSDVKLDTERIVAEEIETNANTVEFVDADAEIVEEPKMPDFMKAE